LTGAPRDSSPSAVHARLGSRRNWRPFDRWIFDRARINAELVLSVPLLAHREIR
jgi:hypothetical protein